jgi:hypothetical protein
MEVSVAERTVGGAAGADAAFLDGEQVLCAGYTLSKSNVRH